MIRNTTKMHFMLLLGVFLFSLWLPPALYHEEDYYFFAIRDIGTTSTTAATQELAPSLTS